MNRPLEQGDGPLRGWAPWERIAGPRRYGDPPVPATERAEGNEAEDVELSPEIAGEIVRRCDGMAPPETLERCAVECYSVLARGARVTSYLPLLTERMVRDRLRGAARLPVEGEARP